MTFAFVSESKREIEEEEEEEEEENKDIFAFIFDWWILTEFNESGLLDRLMTIKNSYICVCVFFFLRFQIKKVKTRF